MNETELREKYLDRVLHTSIAASILLLSEIVQIIPVSPTSIAPWIAIFEDLNPFPEESRST